MSLALALAVNATAAALLLAGLAYAMSSAVRLTPHGAASKPRLGAGGPRRAAGRRRVLFGASAAGAA